MRKTHLFIVAITLMAVACKKQPTELNPINAPVTEVPESNISNPCYGNNWTIDQDYMGIRLAPCFVYNNKAYFVNRRVEPTSSPYQKTVTIYDGTNWEVKASNVPGQITSDVYSFRFVIGNKGYVSSPNGVLMFA